VFSGMSPDGKLPEIVEIPDHPWFIGVQFHPELKSKPSAPTQLTQITPERIQAEGKPVQEVLTQFAEFCGSDMVWAWGKDENVAMALAAFYGGFPPTLPATQFDNMSKIFLKAGMEHDVLVKTRSNQLAAHFGVDPGELTAHDGLDDALSIFHALKFLVDQKKVNPAWLLKPFSK
jgi:DNA polymerase III epsilon subunit-like protein